MRKLFWTCLFLTLLVFSSIAQDDCSVFGIQQLAQEYLQLDIDSVELGELGEHRFFLSNGQEVVYFLGCTDPDFVEFSPAATLNDGTCATPAIPGCTNSAYIEFLPSANVDDGSCASLNPDPTCVDSVSHWGRWYDVVLLGEQCWFAENLNAVDCEGCDGLYDFQDSTAWRWTNEPAFCRYPLDNGDFNDEFGTLFNWYARSAGLCPAGWSLPSENDFNELAGWYSTQANSQTLGGALKTVEGWVSPNVGAMNSLGFDGLPSGFRSKEGEFSPEGTVAYFHTSTTYGGGGVGSWRLTSGSAAFIAQSFSSAVVENRRMGMAVRCVRNAE
jgi:uncharacterized protein (TIGR02145 family)